jgi:hypothetical protein
MTILQSSVDYMWGTVILPRVGDVYVYGGSLSPSSVNQGTDCSGACSEGDEAMEYGPQMNWTRQFYTGTFAGANPGDRGPFAGVGLTSDWQCISSPQAAPPGAAMIVAVLQLSNPEDAHMVCAILDNNNLTGYGGPGVYVGIESGGSYVDANGNSTLHVGPIATSVSDPMFNQWFCTGPVTDDQQPTPPPPLTADQQNALTVIAAGEALGITPLGLQMGLACALDESNMTMYANSNVPASLALPYTLVGDNGESCGPFQQQAQFGWGTVACEMDWTCSATLFFTALAKTPYNAGQQTPGWYIQQVQESATADGSNYQARWDAAVALYNSVINLPPEGFLMALTDAQQTQLYNVICGQVTSQSPFRALGEAAIWEPSSYWGNDDGMSHPQYVEWAASLGDPVSLAVLNEIAAADITTYPDRIEDARLATAVLARIAGGSVTPPVVPPVVLGPPGPTPVVTPAVTPVTPAPAPATPGVTITTAELMQWGKDAVSILGALGTWATAVHGMLGQFLPGTSGTVVPAVIAAATVGFSGHTVHQRKALQAKLKGG